MVEKDNPLSSQERHIQIYKNTCNNFGRLLDDMSIGPANDERQDGWTKRRKRQIAIFGRDSIYTVLPKQHDSGYGKLTEAINYLVNKANVNTKLELKDLDLRKFEKSTIEVGSRTVEILSSLQKVCSAEYFLSWSSYMKQEVKYESAEPSLPRQEGV